MEHIDIFTVFIGAIIYTIIKWLWYSPYLFKNIYEKENPLKNNKMKRNKFLAIFLTFFNGFIISYFISFIEVYVGATSFWDGVLCGLILWFGFAFTTHVTTIIWRNRLIKSFLIKEGFLLFIYMFLGAILVG